MPRPKEEELIRQEFQRFREKLAKYDGFDMLVRVRNRPDMTRAAVNANRLVRYTVPFGQTNGQFVRVFVTKKDIKRRKRGPYYDRD